MIKQGVKQTAKATVIPSPTGGIDTRQPLARMSADTCIYNFNLVPASYGMTVRKGYREWATKIQPSSINKVTGVRSILVFSGSVEGTYTDDKLFAVTEYGIWDVTDPSVNPILKLIFNVQSESAGFGVDCHYIDQGGHEFLLYADERNGLFTYDAGTDTWAQTTGIGGGIVIEEVVFVVVHKLRLWLVERDSGDAWYLPVSSMQGTATKFHFGSKFAHGGKMKGLWNWTIDGGAGVDDYLIAVSSSGDVLPFKGSDPSDVNTWTLVGSYYIGEMPIGRRIASASGGMLFFLSSYGVVSMQDLLKGVNPQDISIDSIAAKIAPLIRDHMGMTKYEYGWELFFSPSEGLFIINSPPRTSYPQVQYVMSMTTKGWGIWRDLDVMCLKEWNGRLFFGFEDRVLLMTDYLDDVKKDAPPPTEMNGKPIKFSFLTAFGDLGSQALYKQVQIIRPDFLAKQNPDYASLAVYDYKIAETDFYSGGGVGDQDYAHWDFSIWDFSIWGDSLNSGKSRIFGASNIGRTVAIAIQGSAVDEVRLLSIDVIFTTGGAL